jgi:general stress protein YciG
VQQLASGKKRLQGPRCTAKTKAGNPCQALAGSDGLCSAHRDPERMRELGRRGGKSRGGIKPERAHEGLREYLKREVPPERVWRALELAMEGQNESARVAASRVLMDALAEPAGADGRAHQADAAAARAKLDQLIERYVAEALGVGTTNPRVLPRDPKGDSPIGKTIARAVAKAREGQEAELVALIEEILVKVRNGLKLVDPLDAEAARTVLEGLAEIGLYVPRGKVEERAEEIAQARLHALKAEHGLT